MKTFQFEVHGPFDVPLRCSGSRRRLDDDGFWHSDTLNSLSAQSGCYVFALRSVKGNVVPEYVGLTRRGFAKEVFNPSNLKKYRRALSASPRHRPVLFLIAHPKRNGKLNRMYIGELETFLIQAASARNPEVKNTKGVFRPKWKIRGVTGRRPEKPPRAAAQFRAAMELP